MTLLRAGIFASANETAPAEPITSIVEIVSSFVRPSTSPDDITATFNGTFGSDRWLVGIIFNKGESVGIDVTIDSTPVDSFGAWIAGTHGYVAFVAQPTGDPSCFIQWTGLEDFTPGESGVMIWEVRSPVKPILVDSGLSNPGLVSVGTVSDGAGLACAIQTSSTPPSGDFGMVLTGASSGWSMFSGLVFPTSGAALAIDAVNNSALAISIR